MKQTIVKITKCRECPHCASSKWYCCLIKRGLPDGDGLPDWCPLEDAPPAPPPNVPAEAEGETPLLDAATELLEVSDLRGDSEMPNPCDDPKLWTSRAQEAWENLRIAVDEKEAEKPAPASPQPSREARKEVAAMLRIRAIDLGIEANHCEDAGLTIEYEQDLRKRIGQLGQVVDWLESGINDGEGK